MSIRASDLLGVYQHATTCAVDSISCDDKWKTVTVRFDGGQTVMVRCQTSTDITQFIGHLQSIASFTDALNHAFACAMQALELQALRLPIDDDVVSCAITGSMLSSRNGVFCPTVVYNRILVTSFME